MWQMVFANFSVKGWVIDPYEQSFFNCPGKVLVLPSNYAEVNISFVTWDVTVVMNGRGGLLMFFEPFCKGSCTFSYIFFLTPVIFVFIWRWHISGATVINVVIPSTTIWLNHQPVRQKHQPDGKNITIYPNHQCNKAITSAKQKTKVALTWQ